MTVSVQERLAEWQTLPLDTRADGEGDAAVIEASEPALDSRQTERALRLARESRPHIPFHVAPAHMDPI